MFTAYLRTFKRMGLTAIPMMADTGPIGGDLSHEFIILASTGESEVFCHRDFLAFETPPETIDFDDAPTMQAVFDRWTSLYAATSEKHDAAAFGELPESARISARGIEVGHIFYFGTKYSQPMKAVVNGPDGREQTVHMGSYGIGPSRLAAALIEANHDEAGPIWPEAVAPFRVGLINLKVGDAACDGACRRVYDALGKAGVDVLYDDRDERPGAKFAAMDLVGAPHQAIVGPKSLAEGKVELKTRRGADRELVSVEAAIAKLCGTA
jgi:prolyl-tRNA synthetase